MTQPRQQTTVPAMEKPDADARRTRPGIDMMDVLAEWALYVSAALITVGLITPSLHRDGWIGDADISALSLIADLFDKGHQLLALIICLFAIAFPLAKTIVAALVFRLGRSASKQTAALLQFLGKWSMLDVFLAAVLIAFSELSTLFDLEPLRGLWFFAGGVILNNLATARLSFSRAS